MRLDFIREVSSPWRRLFALGCIGAFLVTIALSAAPRLHEQLHPVQGAEHNCAVTLLSLGNCDQTSCEPITIAPQLLPPDAAFSHHHFPSVTLCLEFSLLEHAPPALS
ncbi:MAG: hypothetical protein ABJB09_06190 [Verrucomicrobiota bacterium]